MHVELVASDTASKLIVFCVDSSKKGIDLTGQTVRVKYRANGGALVTRVMSNLSQVTDIGRAVYVFQAGELPAGTIEGEFSITDGGGLEMTSTHTFSFAVRPRL